MTDLKIFKMLCLYLTYKIYNLDSLLLNITQTPVTYLVNMCVK